MSRQVSRNMDINRADHAAIRVHDPGDWTGTKVYPGVVGLTETTFDGTFTPTCIGHINLPSPSRT